MSNFQDEVPPPLYVPEPSSAPLKEIRTLAWSAPLQWLQLGWHDLFVAPRLSLAYGSMFWVMAMVLGAVFRNKPEFTMMMASGCLLMGPFLALGLYDVSRRRELGLTPSFVASATCWKNHLRSMGMLVGVLVVLELLWGRASLVVIALFFNTGMPSSLDVTHAVFNPNNWDFVVAYALVGGFFAMLVFSIAAVSIPMILDRDTDAISAAIASLAVVLNNTGVMVFWGALITLLTALALLLPWSLGVLLAGPLLGHASWHAYRAAIHWLTPESIRTS